MLGFRSQEEFEQKKIVDKASDEAWAILKSLQNEENLDFKKLVSDWLGKYESVCSFGWEGFYKNFKEMLELGIQGYRKHETDWEIHRGIGAIKNWRILDAKISADGMYVFTKIGPPKKEWGNGR